MGEPVVILIHIGEIFYGYINECIKQIKLFNDCKIYLAISESHFDLVQYNVELIALEHLAPSEEHLYFNSNTLLNKFFRGGFWHYASERFFILEEVVKKYNLQNVFHLENDVMLYVNLNEIHLDVEKNGFKFLATFDNDNRCIPGFLYFKSHNEINDLVSFASINKGKFNDMELIALYNKQYNKIDFFPLIPDTYFNYYSLNTNVDSEFLEEYYKNYKYFNSIFDAAAIGQFVGGIDSRNASDRNYNGKFVNESCIFNVSDFVIQWKLDICGRAQPFLFFQDSNIRINNLHIHSKLLCNYRSI